MGKEAPSLFQEAEKFFRPLACSSRLTNETFSPSAFFVFSFHFKNSGRRENSTAGDVTGEFVPSSREHHFLPGKEEGWKLTINEKREGKEGEETPKVSSSDLSFPS